MNKLGNNETIIIKKTINASDGYYGDMNTFAKHLIKESKKAKWSIMGIFNGYSFRIDDWDSEKKIMESCYSAMHTAKETYNNSDEGKNLKEKEIAERNIRTEKTRQIIEKLPTLDFSNDEDILDWIKVFAEESDMIRLSLSTKNDTLLPSINMVEREKNTIIDNIIKKFEECWYYSEMNMEEKFNKNDKKNYTWYIIWQAIYNLKTYKSIHPAIGSFINDRKIMYWEETQEKNRKITDLQKLL